MPSEPDDAGTPSSGDPEAPAFAGSPASGDRKDVVPSSSKVKGFQWVAGWVPGTSNELLSKIPRLLQFPNKGRPEASDLPPKGHSEPNATSVPAPSSQAIAASIQLQQTVAVAITKALTGWAGFLGRSAVIKLTAEKFTATVIDRTGSLLKEAVNDPDLHKVAVTVVKEAVIEAAYMAGGRVVGRAMEGVANNVAERFLRALGSEPAAAKPDAPSLEISGPTEPAISGKSGDSKLLAAVDPPPSHDLL